MSIEPSRLAARRIQVPAWLPARAWTLALTLLLWASQVTLPLGVARGANDGSYQSAMDYFMASSARCGVDWVYTYGPLGACQALTFHPGVFWWKVAIWELGFKFLAALSVVLALWRARDSFQRVVPYVLIVVAPLWTDAFVLLGLLAASDLVFEAPRSRARWVLAILVLGLASLSKNTSLILAGPTVGLLIFVIARRVGRRAAWTFAGGFVGFWLAVWIACGQRLLDLPTFLVRSLDLASSYNAGMATEAPPGVDVLGFFLLGMGVAIALLAHGRSDDRPSGLARAAAHAWIFFGAFKAGFVRGADHVPIFTIFAATALFLGAPLSDVGGGAWRAACFALRWGTLAVVVPLTLFQCGFTQDRFLALGARLGTSLDSVWDFVQAPGANVAAARTELAHARAERSMPATRARIGSASVDIHAPYQDLVLMNDFNWRPRPVFQPYAVLSPALERLNAEFLSGPNAPQFYLLDFFPIDAHLPTMEDAALLQVLARDYEVVLRENGYLLLERDPAPGGAGERTVVIERDLRVGEVLDLSGLEGRCHLLQLGARPTAWGQARTLLLRPAALYASIATAQGRVATARLVPEMLQAGAILDPLLYDTADWLRWQEGQEDHVRSFTLLPPEVQGFWPATLHVRIVRADDLVPRRARNTFHLHPPYAMLATQPTQVFEKSSIVATPVEGRAVLEVGVNSALYYRLAPGKHRVSGAYGIVPAGYESGHTEGVLFQVLMRARPGEGVRLLRRLLDPLRVATDRGRQELELEFACEQPVDLVFRTSPAAGGATLDDRAYWTDLRVE